MPPVVKRPDLPPGPDLRPLSAASGPAPPAVLGTAILQAKLHPPLLHTEHVPRPRLIEVLDVPRPLTLLDAPTGFGKSTLLAAWCAQGAGGRPVAWLSLDEDDNDPALFWSYILHALRRIAPGCFGEVLSLLDHPGVSLSRAVLPAVLNELWSLDQPLVLVLDDYHLVRDAACHESLRFFLRRLPSTLRVVIASRTDPPLGLATLRAQGQLTELRAAPLRFTEAEAESLLAERLGLPITVSEVARLTARTEGWPAGLYLAALSMQGREDVSAFIDTFSGQSRHLVDYLSTEVLDRLSEETRAFLLETSVLDALSAPLCNAVTGRTNAAIHLTEMQRANQFLMALDEQGTWYRYHHLFQELLQLELERTAPARVSELHARAAGWYRSAGNPIGAMRHALAEPDYALAADIFLENAESLQATGRFATVEAWMDQLPATAVTIHPSLALAVAWVATLAYRPKWEVERWLTAATATNKPTACQLWRDNDMRSSPIDQRTHRS